MGSPSDWYLVNQWPLSMLIAVEGSGGSSSACIAVSRRPDPGLCGHTRQRGDLVTDPDPARPADAPALEHRPRPRGERVRGRGSRGRRRPLRGARLRRCDRRHRGSVDPGIPTRRRPPAGGRRPVRSRSIRRTSRSTASDSSPGSGSASGASDEDRETVETSYEMMSAIPDWTPTPPDATTPAYVIAGGGSEDGEDWRLELRPGGSNVDSDARRRGRPTRNRIVHRALRPRSSGRGPTRSSARSPKAATGVEFRGPSDADRSRSRERSCRCPRACRSIFDLFFIDLTGWLRRARRPRDRAGCGDADRGHRDRRRAASG